MEAQLIGVPGDPSFEGLAALRVSMGDRKRETEARKAPSVLARAVESSWFLPPDGGRMSHDLEVRKPLWCAYHFWQ